MPAETYKGVEFDSQFEVIPADVIEKKEKAVEAMLDKSLFPNSEDAKDIGQRLAVLALSANAIAEGLLINSKLTVVPVLSRGTDKLAAITKPSGSVVLWRLFSDPEAITQQCQFKDGQIVRPGYLSLRVKDFRFKSGQDAGVFDAVTDPVSRYSTAIYGKVKQYSATVEEKNRILDTIWRGLFILPTLRK